MILRRGITRRVVRGVGSRRGGGRRGAPRPGWALRWIGAFLIVAAIVIVGGDILWLVTKPVGDGGYENHVGTTPVNRTLDLTAGTYTVFEETGTERPDGSLPPLEGTFFIKNKRAQCGHGGSARAMQRPLRLASLVVFNPVQERLQKLGGGMSRQAQTPRRHAANSRIHVRQRRLVHRLQLL